MYKVIISPLPKKVLTMTGAAGQPTCHTEGRPLEEAEEWELGEDKNWLSRFTLSENILRTNS